MSDPEWTFRKGRKFVEMGVKISSGTHLTESMHKAPGGLIRTHLLARDNRIENLMLSGDFTCLPEDGVDRLCAALAGTSLEQESLTAAIAGNIGKLGLDLPGLQASDIATAIKAAIAEEA